MTGGKIAGFADTTTQKPRQSRGFRRIEACGQASFQSVFLWQKNLDLANQVQRRSQCFFAFFPLGRANFARMVANVLGSFNLAQQVVCVTADAFSSDFHGLDNAIRIDQESSTVCQALAFTHNTEVVGDGASLVAYHVVLDLADGVGSIVPCFVGEVSVGRHGEHFNAQLLQLFVLVSYVAQLGRANEGEVSRVEEEDGPLAFNVCFGDFYKLALLECGSVERFDFAVNNTHLRIAPVDRLGCWLRIGAKNTAFAN